MLQNREGHKVPQVAFRTRTQSDWKTLTTDDIFKGKTVVVFSLPGAGRVHPDLLVDPCAAL